jgi:hypothetical protein
MNNHTIAFNQDIWADLITYVDKHNALPTVKSIAEIYHVSNRVASGYYFALNNRFDVTDNLVIAKKHRALTHANATLKSELKSAHQEIALQEARIYFLEAIELLKDHDFKSIKISQADPGQDENTVITIISDGHGEEKVDPETINSINEYNMEIAEERIRRYFARVLYMVRVLRKGGLIINHLVLGVLGDMITGHIHPENVENNLASPTEATMFIQGLISDGIKFLSEDGDFNSIKVVMIRGNHSRTTQRKRFATGYKNSFEWMMYTQINKLFKQELQGFDNVEFIIPKGEFAYVDVYNTTNSFSHGDHFRYMGGVGGVIIPFQKWIYRMNDILPADKRFIAHWHQYTNIPGGCINGSVIGYNAFAMGIGAKPEPPKMQFQLVDSKRDYTINTPIYLQDW